MPVIEAQCASIRVPHDHRHINQNRMRRRGRWGSPGGRRRSTGGGCQVPPGYMAGRSGSPVRPAGCCRAGLAGDAVRHLLAVCGYRVPADSAGDFKLFGGASTASSGTQSVTSVRLVGVMSHPKNRTDHGNRRLSPGSCPDGGVPWRAMEGVSVRPGRVSAMAVRLTSPDE
jgi:hypothetical protein